MPSAAHKLDVTVPPLAASRRAEPAAEPVSKQQTAAVQMSPAQGQAAASACACLAVALDQNSAAHFHDAVATAPCDITVRTATTAAQAEAVLKSQPVDLIVIGFDAGQDADADPCEGARLVESLMANARYRALPFAVVTAVEDAPIAIKAFRAGAIDCLAADDLAPDVIARIVESASAEAHGSIADLQAVISNLRAENAALRRNTLRNMRLLKADMTPLAGMAWQTLKHLSPEARTYRATAARLARLTRSVTGLLDDTTILNATYRVNSGPVAIDLTGLVENLVQSDDGEIADSRANIVIGDLPRIQGRQAELELLFRELIIIAVRKSRLGHVPEIRIDAGRDVEGRPIVWLEDDGLHLEARTQALSGTLNQQGSGPSEEDLAFSLCQQLAEKNDGQLRLSSTANGGTRVAIRFPAPA